MQRKKFGEFYIAHHNEFEKLFSILDDEESKRTLENVIAFRQTWDIRNFDKIRKGNQYFRKIFLDQNRMKYLLMVSLM